MRGSCEAFVRELLELEPSLQVVRDEAIDYWTPEEPPVTTLFAEFGMRVARDFDALGRERAGSVLALVERSVGDGDEALRTAVATGLIEALAAVAEKRPGTWERIRAAMGPASRSHADAWLAGGG